MCAELDITSLMTKEMTFRELFWAHLTHKEMRLINTLMMTTFGVVALTTMFLWPAERQMIVIVGYGLFLGWMVTSPPLFYALAEISPTLAKRHLAFTAQASWKLLTIQMIITSVVCLFWVYSMETEYFLYYFVAFGGFVGVVWTSVLRRKMRRAEKSNDI